MREHWLYSDVTYFAAAVIGHQVIAIGPDHVATRALFISFGDVVSPLIVETSRQKHIVTLAGSVPRRGTIGRERRTLGSTSSVNVIVFFGSS